MFSKPTKGPESADAAGFRSTPVVASLIAADVAIRGDVASAGDMHLDGAIEGDVKVGHLVVGETGSVTGQIEAEQVEIRGRVCGTIVARVVKLHATAHVAGDVTHAELSIEAGAHFEGRSLVFAAAVEAPLSVAAE